MIGWTTINPVLIEVFTEIARDTERLAEGFTAEWKEGRRGFVSPHQKLSLLLKVTTVVGVGEDETRREVVAGNLIETQVGHRRFNLQVQVICPEHTDEVWAMAATERMRTRIMRPSIVTQLLTVDVAVLRIGQATKSSFLDRGHVVSSATIDFTMATVVNDTDDVPAGWIQYAILTGHLQDTGGTELPAPPNWDEHEIPTIP